MEQFQKQAHRVLDGDPVHDPARILRVPGTLNHKSSPPSSVKVVHNTMERFSIGQLEDNLAVNGSIPSYSPYIGKGINNNSVPSTLGTLNGTDKALAGVPEGQRDITVFRLAMTLRDSGVPLDFAIPLIKQAAANCDPPFPEEEALRKAARIITDSLIKSQVSLRPCHFQS